MNSCSTASSNQPAWWRYRNDAYALRLIIQGHYEQIQRDLSNEQWYRDDIENICEWIESNNL